MYKRQAIGNTDAIPLVFSTSNTERLRILSTGSVGIGITNPDQKLHVYEQSGSSQAYLHIQNNRSRNAAVKFTTTQGSWLLGQGIGADVDRFIQEPATEKVLSKSRRIPKAVQNISEIITARIEGLRATKNYFHGQDEIQNVALCYTPLA